MMTVTTPRAASLSANERPSGFAAIAASMRPLAAARFLDLQCGESHLASGDLFYAALSSRASSSRQRARRTTGELMRRLPSQS